MSAPTTRVWVECSFDAGHSLPMMPQEHKCARLHGHTYRLRATYAGPVDPTSGMVVDYAVIKAALDVLVGQLDHQYLNNVRGLENPTCELVARWLWDRLDLIGTGAARLAELTVRETERAGVTLTLDGAP